MKYLIQNIKQFVVILKYDTKRDLYEININYLAVNSRSKKKKKTVLETWNVCLKSTIFLLRLIKYKYNSLTTIELIIQLLKYWKHLIYWEFLFNTI